MVLPYPRLDEDMKWCVSFRSIWKLEETSRTRTAQFHSEYFKDHRILFLGYYSQFDKKNLDNVGKYIQFSLAYAAR